MNMGYQVIRLGESLGEGKVHCSLYIPCINVGKVKLRFNTLPSGWSFN